MDFIAQIVQIQRIVDSCRIIPIQNSLHQQIIPNQLLCTLFLPHSNYYNDKLNTDYYLSICYILLALFAKINFEVPYVKNFKRKIFYGIQKIWQN